MYCIDTQKGDLLWKKNTGMRIEASTIANKKHVLLINMRGDLILLDVKNGSTVWNYELGASAINAPAVIENTIIVAGSDGNVYFLN